MKGRRFRFETRISGIFGTQARSRDATGLIKKAIELRQEREITGVKNLVEKSPDEIKQIGELAENGDVDALFKLDSLLSDATGSSGNLFRIMNFKPETYIEKLLERRADFM